MSKFALLDGLPDADTRAVLAASRRRKYRRNEPICREGEPGDTLHLIDKGHVAIRAATPQGDTATMRVLGPGHWFGEIAVLEGSPRAATVVALDATETLSLHRDVIEQLRGQHLSIDRMLMAAALVEVRRLTRALTDALYTPVPKRLVASLADLLAVFDDGVIPLTQDDLAGLCGTTRQTANEVLQTLVANGTIALSRGRITVLDASKLTRSAR
ncbi:MAG: Crp/Fnr family transcriptional regulator [Actinobacteria bacterium]|nr:Crp/Fnr family transcriptional regulator [Actinomycetota bacterium]